MVYQQQRTSCDQYEAGPGSDSARRCARLHRLFLAAAVAAFVLAVARCEAVAYSCHPTAAAAVAETYGLLKRYSAADPQFPLKSHKPVAVRNVFVRILYIHIHAVNILAAVDAATN